LLLFSNQLTITFLRGHLYRHHRIFPCQRCKTLFDDQQQVNDHLNQPKGCEFVEAQIQDGVTNEIVEKLRSKEKASRDQTEADRWREIYQILFPGEMVPSPCMPLNSHRGVASLYLHDGQSLKKSKKMWYGLQTPESWPTMKNIVAGSYHDFSEHHLKKLSTIIHSH
jgi:hypothetical protein